MSNWLYQVVFPVEEVKPGVVQGKTLSMNAGDIRCDRKMAVQVLTDAARAYIEEHMTESEVKTDGE